MKEILNILLDFIISYTLIFILYYFFFVFKKTKYNKKKVPVEYYYLVRVYGLDEKKINYKKFLYTMNNIDIMGQLSKETIQNDKLLRKLKSAIELQRMSAKERLAYELSIAAERDLAACMATSFEEGEEKGIAKGITEGMRKIILNMKQAGMDLATIAKTAGLPEKEVEALLK